MNFLEPKTVLDLQNIRDELVKMEDTIIFDFIERSHFAVCSGVYQTNNAEVNIPNFDGSFLDWSLMQIEIVHSQLRRFESPDQTPFYPEHILKPILPSVNYPKVLASYDAEINYNDKIKHLYIDQIVPMIAKRPGEQKEQMGSITMIDIETLQNLSRRIHFGKFVAEAKYQSNKELYKKLIINKNVDGIMESITNSQVEEKILERLRVKAQVYGVDPTNKEGERKITPEYLVRIYRDFVIPMTKEVEVEYLLRRLEDEK
ncbi:chorismate mutase aro7 [Hanseniaspora vineae]